jgi:osmoprotectant transport system permease protein
VSRVVGRRTVVLAAFLTVGAISAAPPCPLRAADLPRVAVASKAFPESWVLGEALAGLWRAEGFSVDHRRNLGGTEIVYQALRSGSVDAYPEYTGTIREVILHTSDPLTLGAMREQLVPHGIGIGDPLGFNDGYALAVTDATQRRYGLRRLSDLAEHPELRYGLTHEFLGRPDGFPGLAKAYGLGTRQVRGIQHELAYTAIATGNVDVIDIYTTDAQIGHLGLHVLEDDRKFFPRYEAVWLYRLDLETRAPKAMGALRRMAGSIDEATMIRANARVVLAQQSVGTAADSLLLESLVGERAPANKPIPSEHRLVANTLQHMKLVGLSLLAAVLIGVPLGVLATRTRALAAATLAGAGLLQTIPSLAMLAFLIPLLGIGVGPALVALFLYSLLPIVRNTYVGIITIPPALSEAAAALGLRERTQLWRIRLPMAAPAIMAGIKTSAVINVGTATLAALIGAGGLGDPILAGIQLRRTDLILQGAIPAALLALAVQWTFDAADRIIVPRGLRLPPEPN